MTKTKKPTKRRRGQSDSKAMLAGTPVAWAWECDFGLCAWAEPDRKGLFGTKPSPEAKAVAVRSVKESEYRKLKRMMTATAELRREP